MFRIRRVFDDVTALNRRTIEQVQAMLRVRLPALAERDIAKIPELLHDPMRHRFRAMLLVAETVHHRVTGCALVSYEPRIGFAYLDYIAAGARVGGGVGAALYERVREEARRLRAIGLLFECLPDDPELCADPEVLEGNRARLRFYERFGARPIVGTRYETPLEGGGDNPPYLVFDDLGAGRSLARDEARSAVCAILERKYAHLCPPEYVRMVVRSFVDDPVRLREPRYRRPRPVPTEASTRTGPLVALVVNDRHDIHHVRERGYVEAPVRIAALLRELEPSGMFRRLEPRRFPDRWLEAVHDRRMVDYFEKVCATLRPGHAVYPYVFPIRNQTRPPRELAVRAGYYCIDTFTPLSLNAFLAARRAVDCALTAAEEVLAGTDVAYALVRPPGHHAERRAFGGFCYFNNGAVAAEYLSRYGRVAMLDLDYHHGNGQQEIFWRRGDVLTVSIHGDPRFAYPYFSGFAEEVGEGEGNGANLNLPLGEAVDGVRHRKALAKALARIAAFAPAYLVVCLGLDTARRDPTGTWSLAREDFRLMGRTLGALPLPSVVVQEGGYNTRSIGGNARAFFEGLTGARSG